MKAKYQSGTSFCIEISDRTSRTCMTVADAVRLKEELTRAIDDAEKDKKEEMTRFEKGLNAFLFDFVHTTVEEEDPTEYIKKNSGILLALAKKQLLQTGELLTQEHHEKLMETQYNETLDGVKKNWRDYFTPQAVTDIYNAGRNDILKDLPRWEKYPFNAGDEPVVNGIMQSDGSYEWRIYLNGYKIEISDLKKLPGFKEDESHE